MAGIRVTATDLETGETSACVIEPGNYVLIAAAPCDLAHQQHHANGTTVLTLKGCRAGLMGTREVAPGGEG